MVGVIDYYYVGASPFAYLGHQAIRNVAAKHGMALAYKPINIAAVWEKSGSLPLPQRGPVRQRYRLIELQRLAHFRGLPLNVHPAYFPLDPTLCDSCAIAIIDAGGDPGDYIASVMKGVWVEEANMADEATITGKLTEAGFDAAAILEAAKSDKIARIRSSNTSEAIENDAIGAPAFVVNGEVFWGQDRIEHIDHALSTGREPFSAVSQA